MKFDPCEVCGSPVRQRRVTFDLRRRGRLYVFNQVPVGVCSKCGTRHYPGPILERLDELAEHGMRGARKVSVPTFNFAKAG